MTKPRLNLNEAARQVAAAWGLTVRFRETFEPTSGKLVVRWVFDDAAAAGSNELTLRCVPALWGVAAGWQGSVELTGPGGEWRMSRSFVVANDQLFGRAACALARERFCAWAAALAPNSRRGTMEKPQSREGAAAVKSGVMAVAD